MITSQKKIAQTVGFHALGRDSIKNVDKNSSDLYTFSGEKFMQDVSKKIFFLYPIII